MKKNILPLLLLGMVFISGCIGQTPTLKEGRGLSVKSFSPDFEEVRSGEEITLTALIENVGENDADDVEVQLFGLNLDEWDLLAGDNPQPLNILRKADTALDLPGESFEFSWNLESPYDMRVDNIYTANIRTYYKYTTSALATLRFMSYDYIKSLPSQDFEEAKDSTGVTQSSVTAAPISASVNVGNRPLVVYKDEDTFSVQLIITNVGNGNPFRPSEDYPGQPNDDSTLASKDLYYVDVDIDTGLDLDCSNTLGSKKSGELRLTRGTSRTLFCTATIPSRAGLGNTKDYAVTVNLEYGYFIDASTKIKVLKTEFAGGETTSDWECVTGSSCSSDNDCPSPPPDKSDRDCRNGLCCYR